MDSILVSAAKALADAIETERVVRADGGFEVTNFLIDWDWSGRGEEELKEGPVFVRVVVPPAYIYSQLDDRNGSFAYGATLTIEIRHKIGIAHQEPGDQEPEQYRLSQLGRLTEQLFEFPVRSLPERRLTLSDHGKVAMWVSESEGLRSTIELVGSVERLHRYRTFLGVIIHAFEITDGT